MKNEEQLTQVSDLLARALATKGVLMHATLADHVEPKYLLEGKLIGVMMDNNRQLSFGVKHPKNCCLKFALKRREASDFVTWAQTAKPGEDGLLTIPGDFKFSGGVADCTDLANTHAPQERVTA